MVDQGWFAAKCYSILTSYVVYMLHSIRLTIVFSDSILDHKNFILPQRI